MALAALKVWIPGEVLTAADQNAERDNILNNALSLISPLTGSLACGGFDLTGIDELAFDNAAANASATRRLRANGANLTWHDGTAAGRLFYAGGTDVPVADGGTGLSSGTSGGVLAFTASATLASSGALTANAVVLGGGAGAAPSSLALGTANQILGMNSGATAHEYKTLTQGSRITLTHAAGSVTIAVATQTRSIMLAPEMFAAVGGAPTISNISNIVETFDFDQTSEETIAATIVIPQDWQSGGFTPIVSWTNKSTGSGDVVWRVLIREFANAANLSTGGTSLLDESQTITAPSQSVLTQTTFTASTAPGAAGRLLNVRVQRTAGNAADTLGNDAGVVSVELRYTGT